MQINLNTNFNINQPAFSQRYRLGQKSDACIHSAEKKEPKIIDFTNQHVLYIPVEDVAPKDRTYDSFTGLRDKNYLLAKLGKSMEFSRCFNKNITIAMFDMDNFKSVNELLGYEAGDDFIQIIGSNINSVARENMLDAYRFGGDEFVLVFDGQNKHQQQEIVDKIERSINDNNFIASKQVPYRRNAEQRLEECSSSTEKINNLINLQMMQTIYADMKTKFQTEEAKNDPYLLKCIKDTDEKLHSSYSELINERLESETDIYTISWLRRLDGHIKEKGNITKAEQKILDEYLKSIYDKTAEMYQIKQWLHDFTNNRGFSITGGIVTFDNESLEGKKPIDLINIAGEKLKQGKSIQKGQSYC